MTKFYTGFRPTPVVTRSQFRRASLPNISESEWVDIDRREIFHKLRWYPDQIDTSGCTGFSSAMCASKARVIAGQPPIKLGGAYLYSLINGGQDRGSNIGNALRALKQYGCAREEICDVHDNRNYIYRKNTTQFDADAARFKGEYAVTIETAEEAAVGLQAGGILEFALKAGRGFGDLDSEGVCRAITGTANHAVHADGMKKTNRSGWCVDMQTWTASFADKSRCLIPLGLLEKVGYQEMWLIFSTIDDPQDTHDPPTPV